MATTKQGTWTNEVINSSTITENLTSKSSFSFCNIPSSSAIWRLNSDVLGPLLIGTELDLFSPIWLRPLSTSENKSSARLTTCNNQRLGSQIYNQILRSKTENIEPHLILFVSNPGSRDQNWVCVGEGRLNEHQLMHIENKQPFFQICKRNLVN